MSKRVIFVCVVFLLLGIVGSLATLSGFASGLWLPNPIALFLPVAIGLGMGYPFARVAAHWLCWITYLMQLVPLLIVGSLELNPAATSSGSFPSLLVATAIFGSLLAYLHWMLFTQPFDEYLKR